MRTLSILKANDESVIRHDVSLYRDSDNSASEEEEARSTKKMTEKKALTLKDHERRRLLTKKENALLSDDEDEIAKATGENADDIRRQFVLEG